jgi:hypothetical protein
MAENDHPLTEQHLQEINGGLDKIRSAQRQIQLAKMAGIDVSSLEAQAADAQEKLTKLKQVYFPGR